MIKIKLPDCVLTIKDTKLKCDNKELSMLFSDLEDEYKSLGSSIPNPEIGFANFVLGELEEGEIVYSDWELGLEGNPDETREKPSKRLHEKLSTKLQDL